MSRARTRRTRAAAVSLAALLPLGLAACGSFGGGDDSAEGSSDGTITFWQYYGDEEMPTGAPLYDVLEKYDDQNDDVEVDIRFIPFEDFNRTLTQAAASGELPDVALINAFDTQNMAEAGVIEDISDRVEEWGEQDAYFPTGWETTQVDGATYGVPHLADAYAVYYNKDLLKQADVQPPKTWAEMEQTAAKLAGDGKYGLALSGIEGAEGATGLIIRTLADGGTIEKFGDDGGTAALESFQSMVDDGGLSKGFLTWNEEDAKNQFATGEAAMMINSATYVSILRDENPELNWGVALLPKDQTRETFLSAENLTIGEGSGDPDAAWDLISYLQKPDVLADYLPARNKLPARDDVPGTDDDPVRKVFADQLQEAWAPEGDLATHSNEAFTILQEALQATISGASDPADAAETAQSDIDEALSAS
ncbi:ABC transporter substrate-binding protein [Solicola gregarius]|uniref:Sugar ABC transporter substrate-binding protein n=1 Tax=Solicola gregarius TaxID=2908642 RepID=A0AA46TIP3_9ACTN|nr:sugar ABC transporter substrate-binding protein [Solicola gregarius]UYM05567.1 sugar ABC transporter substrate-binding protein [Solicola gregarius]